MRIFFKLTSACLILGLTLHGQALAQSATDRTFGPDSIEYATEAQTLQGQNDHKKAVKRLKKGLKVKGLSAYETSTMAQMLGSSYFALKKYQDAIEAFENSIAAGGLSRTDRRGLQENIAQLNIADKNYALGAQQLERYFQEGGPQKPKLVKMIVQAHLQSKNRAAAVPWAEVMLRQGLISTRREHEVAVYLFDSPEKRSSQMQVARNMLAKWSTDPAVLARIERLNVKAKIDGVPTIAVPG